MSILVHIGYPKTASTWLQKAIFKPQTDVCYLGRYSTNNVCIQFIRTPEHILSPYFEGTVDNVAEVVSEKHKESKGKLIVLSDENLVGNAYLSGINAKSIALRIRNTVPTAKILIIVREQASMILSIYLQYLRAGGTQSISEFLHGRYTAASALFSPDFYAYAKTVELYRDLFNNEVLVMPYELLQRRKEIFISRLSQFCNVEFNLSSDYTIHNQTYNYGLEMALRPLNYFTKSRFNNPIINISGARSLKIRFSRWLGNANFRARESRTKAKISKLIDAKYKDDNRLLQNYTEFNLKEFGYSL